MDDSRRDALLKEYGEVSGNFKLLTDIRFKLLAFLPIATAAAAAIKSEGAGIGNFSLSLFGLVATIGLLTYNARNDQLYNELVARAASIERSLGLQDGSFANRPRPWLTIWCPRVDWKVEHGTGVATIYAASIALWLSGLLAPILEFARQTYVSLGLRHFLVADPSAWVNATAVGTAICATYLGLRSAGRQKKRRAQEMRRLAVAAVERAKSLEFSAVAKDVKFVELCVRLSDGDRNAIAARASFYASIDPESLGHYLLRGESTQTASHFVALLTDLPPRWLFDCATNRRGRA